MSKNFAAEIARLQEGIDSMPTKFADTRKQFVDATVEFLRAWVDSEVERQVKSKADNTKRQGKKLSTLKAEIRTLQEQLPDIVIDEVEQDGNWTIVDRASSNRSHRGREGEFPHYGSSVPQRLSTALRRCGGNLAPILIKYGYLMSNEWLPGSSTIREAPIHGAWSAPMRAAIDHFSSLAKQYQEHSESLSQLQKEKAEAEAADLWKNA